MAASGELVRSGDRPDQHIGSVPAALRRAALPAATVVGALAVWELAPRTGLVRPIVFPPLSEVAALMPGLLTDSTFLEAVSASGGRWAAGLAIALVVGLPLGLLMGRSRPVFAFVNPLLVLTYSVPKAALVLIFALWFGVGLLATSLVIAVGAVTPILIAAYHGTKAINTRLLWSAAALGTTRLRLFSRVVLPAALPQILSGIRVGLQISLFVMLASEFLIRQRGIGAYLFNNLDVAQYAQVWSVIVVIAAAGFLIDVVYVRLVRLCCPWVEGEI
jgi:ABC-type nitrate/sulfonate/bicarbonate transport system permease component